MGKKILALLATTAMIGSCQDGDLELTKSNTMEEQKYLSNTEAFEIWYEHLRHWEGELDDDPKMVDRDSVRTKCGIRYTTFKWAAGIIWMERDPNDLLDRFNYMTEEDHKMIAKFIWDDAQCDKIHDGRVAAVCAEITWGTGKGRVLQRAANKLGAKLKVDGVIGRKSIKAINDITALGLPLYDSAVTAYNRHYVRISKKYPELHKNLNGWLARNGRGYPEYDKPGFAATFDNI